MIVSIRTLLCDRCRIDLQLESYSCQSFPGHLDAISCGAQLNPLVLPLLVQAGFDEPSPLSPKVSTEDFAQTEVDFLNGLTVTLFWSLDILLPRSEEAQQRMPKFVVAEDFQGVLDIGRSVGSWLFAHCIEVMLQNLLTKFESDHVT